MNRKSIQKLNNEEISDIKNRWKTENGSKILQHIVKLIQDNDFSWAEKIKEITLSEEDSELDDLRGIELIKTDLSERDLSYVDLSYSTLIECNLNGSILQNSILNYSDFRKTTFIKADLLQVNADSCNFALTDLSDSILMSAVFRNSNFNSANIQNAVIDGSDFTNTILKYVNFSGTNFDYVNTNNMIFTRDIIGLPLKLTPVKSDTGKSQNTAAITNKSISLRLKQSDDWLYKIESPVYPVTGYQFTPPAHAIRPALATRKYRATKSSQEVIIISKGPLHQQEITAAIISVDLKQVNIARSFSMRDLSGINNEYSTKEPSKKKIVNKKKTISKKSK